MAKNVTITFQVLQDFPQAKVFLSLDLNTSVELMLKIEAKMQIGKYH